MREGPVAKLGVTTGSDVRMLDNSIRMLYPAPGERKKLDDGQ